ncbi:MAG TPA: fibronectin type III domain-containing protein [Propionibacterium sp.]|nr:fibronectin type III domain-containing protein [Propionibacterium sp.]
MKGNRAEAVSVISGRLDARLPAVDDKEAPVTTGFDFSPKLVDVTQGARSVQIAVRVTDTIGVPPSSVAWQLNHETAGLSMVGDYMTLASGNDRDGVYRGEIQVMDPPSNVKAEPFETGGARVTWTPPSVTDPRLSTRYMVTAHPSGATQTVASTTATFTGLPLGEDFTFDVVAVNDAGSSAAGTSNAVRSSIPVKGSVTFVDRCGASGDYFEIPQTGLMYDHWDAQGQLISGQLTPGRYPASGYVRIGAWSDDPSVRVEGPTEWTHTFDGSVPFADVPEGTAFFENMCWMAEKKISTGWTMADGSKEYRPLQPVNRDAMAAFMYRLAGSPTFTPPKVSPFKDITPTTAFYKEMAWLASQGISTGWTMPDGSKEYRPLQPVNRDAMAAFMYRMAKSPAFTPPQASPFKDITPTTQFYKEMAWLADQKISTGWNMPDGSKEYRPVQPVNRDAMAAFMHRYSSR